jgi:hypothetical protein
MNDSIDLGGFASGIRHFEDAEDECLRITCNGCFTRNYFPVSFYLQGDSGHLNYVAYKEHLLNICLTHMWHYTTGKLLPPLNSILHIIISYLSRGSEMCDFPSDWPKLQYVRYEAFCPMVVVVVGRYSETSVNIDQATWCHTLHDSILYKNCYEKITLPHPLKTSPALP